MNPESQTSPPPSPAVHREACPFCRSANTELLSHFGSTLMASQHYCRDCRSPFEAIRWRDDKPAAANGAPR